MYERSILGTEYAALSSVHDRLISTLRGQTMRITNADGTDLRIQVPRDAWFHKNDGIMSPARARQGTSVRDREMEFPAGALRFIPDVSSTEGKLVVRLVSNGRAFVEGVTLEFRGGRVTNWRAEKGEAPLRAAWDAAGGDMEKVCEIVIGTNPLTKGTYEDSARGDLRGGAGAVRISLGDNWESGGSNRTRFTRTQWLYPQGCTMEAGGQTILRQGQLT
jgi:leucyl aminopeptidase (aminopeptidase T)